jgi:hypothetical protein
MSEVDPDIASFFSEPPESVPVGWTLSIPDELVTAGMEVRHMTGRFVQDYKFNDDVQEWCDINMIHPLRIFSSIAVGRTRGDMTFASVNFESERDYIIFKMRWT